MPTIRELVANLGFKVDTTGATRFDAAVNRSRKNLTGLNTVSLSGLVNTATKAFAIVAGVVTAGSLAAAKKFADIQRSWDALKFATGENFGAFKKVIDGILKDKVLKNLFDELDLVNSVVTEVQEKGIKGDKFLKFFRLAALLAIQTKKPFKEVLGLITGFVVDKDPAIFKLLRELPPKLQELLAAAGISLGQVGFIGRGEKVSESLRKVEAELEKNIIEQRERGLTTFKELDGAFDKLAIVIGEHTLPAFKDLNDVIIPVVERLTKLLKGEIKPKEFIEKEIEEARIEPKIITTLLLDFPSLFKGLFDFVEFFTPNVERANKAIQDINREQRKQNIPSITDTNRFVIPFAAQTTNNRGGDTIVNVSVKVESGATGDPTKIKQAVNEGIRETMGKVKELNSAITIRRGGQ